MSTTIKGIAASPGISIAKAFRLQDPDLTVIQSRVSNPGEEIIRFEKAIDKSRKELTVIQDYATKELGEDKAEIFAAHLLILEDPELINPIKDKIANDRVNAEFALNEVAVMFVSSVREYGKPIHERTCC